MATAVQIELMVDEKGAVSGVRSFGSAVKGSAVDVNALDATLQKLNAHLDQLGSKGKKPIEAVGKSALSSKEQVRLLSEEIGVHVPRAMQGVISKCPELMGAIGAVSGAMIALGAIQIGGMMFETAIKGAEKLYHALTALPKAEQDYLDELKKTQDENFGDTHSIETTRARIDEATEAVKRFQQQANGPQTGMGWRTSLDVLLPGAGTYWQHSHDRDEATTQQMGWQRKLDKLHGAESGQWHETRESDIAYRHAGDEALKDPKAKHDAQISEAKERAAEERRLNNEIDTLKGNSVNLSTAGADKEQTAIKIATLKADAELANAQKERTGSAKSDTSELARIHEQAIESGLRGSELLHRQEAAAIADLKAKHIASADAINDIHTKFHNEEMRRQDEEQTRQDRRLAQMRAETSLIGLSGVPRIQQEGKNQINELYSTPGDHLAEVHEINKQTSVRTAEQQKADQEKQKEEADRVAAQHTHSLQETERIEAQARVKSLSAEKQKTAAIQAELEEKLQRYKEELANQSDADEQYERRAAAAQAEANAEMVEAATEARKKMGGEFESFFKGMEDPKRYMKELGDKAAGQAAAGLFQHFQQKHGGANADQGNGERPGIFGGLLNDLGIHGKNKLPGAGADAKAPNHAEQAAHGIFTVSMATIHIGSASIAGGGFGGSTSAGNRSLSADGSTSLLAPRGSVASSEAGAPTGASGSGWGAAGSTSNGFSGGSAGIGAGAEASGSGSNTSDRINGGIGNVRQGIGLANQLGIIGKLNDSDRASKMFGGKLFGSGSFFGGPAKGSGESAGAAGTALSSSDASSGSVGISLPQLAPGTATSGAGSSLPSSSGGSGAAAGAMGTAAGAFGVYSASQGTGGAGGAMKGAMSGAEVGSMFGPIGMAVGAVAGAVIGFEGSGEAARVYDLKTVRPRIGNDKDAYQQGSMDYLSAYSDLQSLQTEAFKATSAMGPSGRRYRDDQILPEIKEAEGKLNAQEKAGRSQYTATAAQMDTGGAIDGFGNLNTTPGHGLVNMQLGEFTVKPNVYQRNKSTLDALNSGASMDAIHASYRSAMQSGSARQGNSGNRTLNMNVQAIDAKGVSQFFDRHKHTMRSALNDSYAENSGGGL